MKTLTIFLDIDGVLNTHTTAKENDWLICPKLVQRLNDFIHRKNQIDIVISSSWRYDMKDLQFQLEGAGFKYWHKVIGKTPTHKILTKRGEQIARWIKDNDCSTPMVVIDDEVHDIVGYLPKVVILQTNPKFGISKELIEHLEILNREML